MKEFLNKKNIITLLLLAILVLAIPVGVRLVKTQQILQSRATGGGITFRGTGVACPASGECSTTERQIEVVLDSPFGASLTPSSSSSASSSSSSSASQSR